MVLIGPASAAVIPIGPNSGASPNCTVTALGFVKSFGAAGVWAKPVTAKATGMQIILYIVVLLFCGNKSCGRLLNQAHCARHSVLTNQQFGVKSLVRSGWGGR